MRILRLKAESDQPNVDQSIHTIVVESEDAANWYGKPLRNPACPTLQWPKFAWKEVRTGSDRDQLNLKNKTGQESRHNSPDPGTNLSTRSGGKIDATEL